MANKFIKLNSTLSRVLLIVFGIFALLFVVLSAKWFLGNSISKRVYYREVADLAVSLGPSDPQTHFGKGFILGQSSELADLPKSLAEYEKAVSLSPNNYILWVGYGRALERNGDSERAEKALVKALELAPNYSEVHWAYGNILLRNGKNSEGFKAIRKAVDGDNKFARPAASVAWDIFEGDTSAIKTAIGNSTFVQSALAILLAGQDRFEESLSVWKSIPEDSRKTELKADSDKLLKLMLAEKKYRAVFDMKSVLDGESVQKVRLGEITDGGFEQPIDSSPANIFGWKIASGSQPVVGINVEQKHDGEKSLAVIFNSTLSKKFRDISQLVVVEGGASYEFEVFYRSTLETNASVKWEVVDKASGNVLAATPSTNRTTDWTRLTTKFQTPKDVEGIVVRLVRSKCTASDCSIAGSIWFDDVSIK